MAYGENPWKDAARLWWAVMWRYITANLLLIAFQTAVSKALGIGIFNTVARQGGSPSITEILLSLIIFCLGVYASIYIHKYLISKGARGFIAMLSPASPTLWKDGARFWWAAFWRTALLSLLSFLVVAIFTIPFIVEKKVIAVYIALPILFIAIVFIAPTYAYKRLIMKGARGFTLRLEAKKA